MKCSLYIKETPRPDVTRSILSERDGIFQAVDFLKQRGDHLECISRTQLFHPGRNYTAQMSRIRKDVPGSE